jgi:hypothetical protein
MPKYSEAGVRLQNTTRPSSRTGSAAAWSEREEDTMHKLIATLLGFVAAVAALVPAISEAGVKLMNHNETLVQDW